MRSTALIYKVELQVLVGSEWVTIVTLDYDTYEEAHKAIVDAMEVETNDSRQRFILRRQALIEHSWVLY